MAKSHESAQHIDATNAQNFIRYNAGMTITPIAQTTAKFRFDSINLFSRIIISFLPIFP